MPHKNSDELTELINVLERENEHQRNLLNLFSQIAQSNNIDYILKNTLMEVANLTGTKYISIWNYDYDSDQLILMTDYDEERYKATNKLPSERIDFGTRVSRGSGQSPILEKVVTEEEPFLTLSAKDFGQIERKRANEYITNYSLVVPFKSGNRVEGVICLADKITPFTEKDKAEMLLLGMILGGKLEAYKELTEKNRDAELLKVLAEKDELTWLYNYRTMKKHLKDQIDLSSRNPQYIVSIALLDIDHFKNVNDTYGHLYGDDVLRQLGKMLIHPSKLIRDTDTAYRYGGEEFLIIYPGTTLNNAKISAENLRKKVESARFTDKDLRISASIGLAQYTPGKEFLIFRDNPNGKAEKLEIETKNLIGLSDQALYLLKSSDETRNHVAYWDPEIERAEIYIATRTLIHANPLPSLL